MAPLGIGQGRVQAGASRVKTRAERCLYLYVLDPEGTRAAGVLDVEGRAESQTLPSSQAQP